MENKLNFCLSFQMRVMQTVGEWGSNVLFGICVVKRMCVFLNGVCFLRILSESTLKQIKEGLKALLVPFYYFYAGKNVSHPNK